MLYAGIAAFGIVMLFAIGERDIAWASVFIYLPFVVLILHIVTRPDSYGDAAAIARHLVDFPYDAAAVADSSAPADPIVHSRRRQA
jgi:hypothetical protein